MFRFFVYLLIFISVYILGMLLAPILPLFAIMSPGESDNATRRLIEPRLPKWLSWFDTSNDNSLWGDYGWRTKHCLNRWATWSGMVMWLWRNCAYGFSWSILAHKVSNEETFNYEGDITLDKNQNRNGYFYIKSSNGAFQYRWVKNFNKFQISLDIGWILDVYIKYTWAKLEKPLSVFVCSPKIVMKR